MNRGVEIDSRVADGPRSVIREQVTAGMAAAAPCSSAPAVGRVGRDRDARTMLAGVADERPCLRTRGSSTARHLDRLTVRRGGRITEASARVIARRADDRIEDLEARCWRPRSSIRTSISASGRGLQRNIETGSRAAAAGGFSDVAVMPNTNPPLDEAYRVRGVIARASRDRPCRVHAIGACTFGA
jgi:hypothetical protein